MAAKNDLTIVDEYIAQVSKEARGPLARIRQIIKKAAPAAVEGFAYGMPAYKLNGKPLVYFAAFQKHIGVYATPQVHEKFAARLAKYKHGKGSVQFPLDKPIPYDLIAEIVKYKASLLD